MSASFAIKVTSNAPEVKRAVRLLRRDQLPFATAVALTRTAQGARDEQRGAMGKRFTLRNKRVERGITIERANKRDWPKTRALVGTRDRFIADHEAGVVRRPRSGQHIAIPSRVVKARRTKTGKVPKSLQPRTLIGRGRAMIAQQGGETVIRLKRKRKRTMGGLRGLFLLRTRVRIKGGRLKMGDTVRGHARRTYTAHFRREFAKAVATARPRSRRR